LRALTCLRVSLPAHLHAFGNPRLRQALLALELARAQQLGASLADWLGDD
jgi:membrane protein